MPDASPPAVGEAVRRTARLAQAAFKANGADVPVVPEAKRNPAKPALFLGDTAFARSHKVDLASLKGWGYVHRVVGKDVIVAGRDHPSPDPNAKASGRPRSWDRVATAKAAADFLHRYAGVRFLYPDVPPWTPVAAADRVDFLASPAFEFVRTPAVAVPAGPPSSPPPTSRVGRLRPRRVHLVIVDRTCQGPEQLTSLPSRRFFMSALRPANRLGRVN